MGGAVELWVHEATARLISSDLKLTVVSRPAHVAGHPHVNYHPVEWTRCERVFKRGRDLFNAGSVYSRVLKMQNVYSYGRRSLAAVTQHDVICIENEPNLLAMLKPQSGQRVILHMHNDHLTQRALRGVYRNALFKADQVIFVSDYLRRKAAAIFPEHEKKFAVLQNGTDTSFFTPGKSNSALLEPGLSTAIQKKRLIVFAGRIVKEKGVDVLASAFTAVASEFPDAVLVLAGSSFYANARVTAFQRHVATITQAVSTQVVMTGYVSHSELSALYSLADIVVVPSVWEEPSGLTVLEAMSSASCIIASDVGGIPELLKDGYSGQLIAPGNPKALADRVIALLRDDQLRARLGKQARVEAVQRFTWERVSSEFAKALEGTT
jgi:spore coat protein SA